MACRTAIGFDPAQKISLKSFDLTSAAALAEPLQILTAFDTGHLDSSKLAEHLSGNIFHRRGTAACLTGKVLFFQYFSGRITVRAMLVEAIADLRVKQTVGCDLDRISAVAAAQPDHLAIEALRRLFDRNKMTKSFIFDILDLSSAILYFFVSDNCWHTTKKRPLVSVSFGLSAQHTIILSCRLRISRQKFMTKIIERSDFLSLSSGVPFGGVSKSDLSLRFSYTVSLF